MISFKNLIWHWQIDDADKDIPDTSAFVKKRDYDTTVWSLMLKGALSGLRHFLVNESLLKIMENPYYFTSTASFVLKIFKFLSWLFGHVAKRLDKKDKVNFKFHEVTPWLRNNFDTHIAKYLEK